MTTPSPGWIRLGSLPAIASCAFGYACSSGPDAAPAPASASPEAAVEAIHRRVGGAWASAALSFRHARDGLVPEVPAPSQGSTLRPPKMILPERATSAFAVEAPSGSRASVRLLGLRDVPAEIADGFVVYRGARSDGGDVVQRVLADGMEDYVGIESRPKLPRVEYEVSLGDAVAGLRLIEGVLELLDASGAPRLRMRRPWIVDATGTRAAAHTTIAGCAYDERPVAPWGRPIVDPGARRCIVRVDWPDGIAYPAALDPAWTTTGSMADARSTHAAQNLPNGKVLVAGGDAASGPIATAEIFDTATGTWASTSSLSTARRRVPSVRLPDGSVLVVDGCESQDFLWPASSCSQPSTSVERYSPTAGAWSPAPPLHHPRDALSVALAGNGKALVVGGTANTAEVAIAELYDPAANTWTDAGSVSHPSSLDADGALVTLLDGRLLVAHASGVSELYDPATGSFTDTGAASQDRMGGYAVAVLSTGQALYVGGGFIQNNPTEWTSDLLDPVSGQFTPGPNIANPRRSPTIAAFGQGNALVVGGLTASAPIPPEAYDAATSSFVATGTLCADGVTATVLPSGAVLFAGGVSNGQPTTEATLFQPATTATSCTADADCASLHCVDGFCCDTPCDKACEACSAAKKGTGADGVCGPVAAGAADPKQLCATEPASTCGRTGLCDGAGACAVYAAKVECVAAACSADGLTTMTGVCDGAGACSQTSKTCAPFKCNKGTAQCIAQCNSDADCAPGSRCDKGACVSSATCADDHTQANADGTVVACSPYRCLGTGCRSTCNSVDDCLAGFYCDANSHCVATDAAPPPADSGSSGGCATADGRRGATGIGAIALLLGGLAARRRSKPSLRR